MNENKILVKVMIQSGFKLLKFALIIGVIIGTISLMISYSDNIVQGAIFVNNFLLPIKHFIQDHIWYFIVGWIFYFIWWYLVFEKTPEHHVNSFVVLRNIVLLPAAVGLIILLCIADMYSGFFYPISFLYILICFCCLLEINKNIAEQRSLLCKGSEA